eukprot:CAMPEP_0116114558 /NCGR_PEP_ID=MMETSP0329-20121206/44_1 /TAXON_ID=697910 /ORGANISM="Pseudo-nitzschia arenysensis, Strain B593" /LENGTH=261 /DNA_ID=CAMNT_0003607945 /DNA_START=31 /DNA_END=816 /DNA_ORIENTATION=+
MTTESKNNHSLHKLPPEIQHLTDPVSLDENKLQVFNADWDEEGVYFYQAYCNEIADYAITHQRFGGKRWNSSRMTWIKPSFAWMLYRAGYGKKSGQERVLRIKLSHSSVAHILSRCKLAHRGHTDSSANGGCGKVQWDPERDLYSPVDRGRLEPRKLPRTRAIQIGMSGTLSEYYVSNLLSVEDVTELAHQIYDMHRMSRKKKGKKTQKNEDEIQALQGMALYNEKPYLSSSDKKHLVRLGMLPGEPAKMLSQLGFGKSTF